MARDAPKSIGREALEAVVDRVDIVEGLNARIRYASDNEAAREFALRYGVPVAAGSDSHFPWEIGRTGVEMEPFSNPQEFLDSLRQGQIFGRRSPYIFAGLTYLIWAIKKFGECLR